MSVRVAINGLVASAATFCAPLPNPAARISRWSASTISAVETNAHLLRFDSVHGRFPGQVTVKGDTISIGNGAIKVAAERDPAKLPWKDLGVDIALECTGIHVKEKRRCTWTAGRQARDHFSASRRR
jgi:glyceraldehyde 3-phosphate dehydrogenase